MKKNTFKRAAALLLALALLFALLPQTAPTARAEDAYSGSCGDDLTWRFDPDTGELTVEGSGAMSFLIPNGPPAWYSPWHAFADQIVSVSLPEGLTSIANNAFLDCSALSSVSIPEGVISLGFSSFEGCGSLGSVTIPESVNRIGEDCFKDCGSLRSVMIPEGVETIYDHTFSGCKSLTELTVPAGVTHVNSKAFANCDALRAVIFLNPMCDIEEDCLDSSGNVTVYGYAGSAAEYLAESQGFPFVSLGSADYSGACGDDLLWTFDPDARTLSIEGSGDMWLSGSEDAEYREYPWHFAAKMITALDLPEGLTTIENQAFQDCSALHSVSIPQTVTAVRSDAFINCAELSSVELPEGLTYLSGFRNCYSLSGISIPSTVTVLGYNAFSHCGALTEIEIPKGVTSIGTWAFDGCWSLPEITLPDGLIEVDSHAFSGCEGLTEMTFPASVSFVGVFALENCDSLSAVTFLNPTCEIGYKCLGDNTRATIYGYCGSTAEAYAAEHGNPFVYLWTEDMQGVCGDDLIWRFDPDTGVLTIEGTGAMYDFLDYSESTESPTLYAPWLDLRGTITSVSLPEGLTYIGAGAFFSCQELTEAALPETLTEIGESAFWFCQNLRTVSLPEGLERIGEAAFMQCYSLASVAFPESLSYLGPNAFNSCSSLTELTFPSNLVSLGAHPFLGCHLSAVTVAEENPAFSSEDGVLFDKEKETLILYPAARTGAYSIPDGVTYIDEFAFFYCQALTDVGIPDSVTSLGSRAFEACTGLRSITLPNSVWYIGSGAFLGCSGLTAFEIPNGVTRISPSTFYKCSNLRSVSIPGSVRSIGYDAFENCVSLTDVTIPYGVTTIGNYAFGGCTGLRSLFIPQSVTVFQGELFTRDVSATIYGFAGSRAEAYAASKNIPFVALTAADLFSDVNNDSWYADAVLWAARFGITSGTGNGKFSPKQACTREQVVTFIWKAYGSQEPCGQDLPFTDVKAEKYYADAVLWAYYHKPQITGGMNDTTFGVGKPCTRAQVVTFLYAAAGKPEPETTENPFTDVKETDYFYKAVLWAAENGVTSGTTPTTFSPKQTCTRAQVVTFLYKAVG